MEARGGVIRKGGFSNRFMISKLQSWSEVIGNLAFHLMVATISSAISAKNLDCFPLAETTWRVCQVGLGLRSTLPTSPTRFRHYTRQVLQFHLWVVLHRCIHLDQDGKIYFLKDVHEKAQGSCALCRRALVRAVILNIKSFVIFWREWFDVRLDVPQGFPARGSKVTSA